MNDKIEYQIAEFNDETTSQLVSLHSRYGYIKRNRLSFEWLYSSKINIKSCLALAVVNNEVCGSYGMIHYPLIKNGVVINSFKGEAVLIDERKRNSVDVIRLFNASLRQSKENGCDLSWGLTSSFPLIRLIYRQTENSGTINLFFLPLKYDFARSIFFKNSKLDRKTRTVLYLIGPLIYARSLFKRSLSGNPRSDISLLKAEKNYDNLERFMIDFSKENPESVFVYPNKEFLAWRVDMNPFSNGEKFVFHLGEKLIGYAILDFHEDMVEILEIIVVSSYFKSVVQLIIKEQCTKARILVLQGNVKNSIFRVHSAELRKFGFIAKPIKSSFVFKPLSNEIKSWNLSIKNFYISNIWSEGI